MKLTNNELTLLRKTVRPTIKKRIKLAQARIDYLLQRSSPTGWMSPDAPTQIAVKEMEIKELLNLLEKI